MLVRSVAAVGRTPAKDLQEVALSGFPAPFSNIMVKGRAEAQRLEYRMMEAEPTALEELVPEAANGISILARMLQYHEQNCR
jgi:hypothetical protein